MIEHDGPRPEDLLPGPRDLGTTELYGSIVEGSADLVVAFDDQGTMVFANRAADVLLGHAPQSLVGRSVFDFVHPDDLERALFALDMNVTYGSAPGTTVFRLAHADGSWVFVDMTGGHSTDDGARVLFTSFSRKADDQFAVTETLMRLLAGSTLAEALRPVCDIFAWERNGSQIGIAWPEHDGTWNAVTTGVRPELVGVVAAGDVATDGSQAESPWAQVARCGEATLHHDLAGLPPRLRDEATAAGLAAYWIEPVAFGARAPALLTVWTHEGGRPPRNHAHGMAIVTPIVELILRWVEQQRQLDHAAFHDPLTGLANRKRFFDALDAAGRGGAVLYCDLDRFKAVNDKLGHAAGDELLRAVAARLLACVRPGDIVARLGGDEFAVLCVGASPDIARDVAERIEGAVSEPFALADTTASVGVSIGIGHADDRIGEDTLEEADRELYRAKDRRG